MPSEVEGRSAQLRGLHPMQGSGWADEALEWAQQADSKSPEVEWAALWVGARRAEVGPGASTERLWAEPQELRGWKDYPAGGEVH